MSINVNNSNGIQVNTNNVNVTAQTNTIINLKPINPLPEKFAEMQRFGLQPYDRSPNDYLRFVANVFTAWRDPNDNILNHDPFDNTYGASVEGETTTTLQATADKSVIAYIDGFQIEYQFTRLTTDAESTDMTRADDTVDSTLTNKDTSGTLLVTYFNENGEELTVDKAKYGEYHRFVIKKGFCFIDNQLINITKDTEWWFRVPEVKEIVNGTPTFEVGQFIVDPLNVYSFLPNRNYNIILSYEYLNQFESNYAQIQFVTDITAIDQPYILLGSFSTNEYGMVHQTQPVNEKNIETFKQYITKIVKNESNNQDELVYYLKDINPQYLDKKYMANHKNLFKNLQSQLLTILTSSKITNLFHCREITEEIDHSVSSGDFVYYNATEKRWYPADVSRQAFDKVQGLYLRHATEGTDFVYFSGVIEIDETYTITDSKNLVLRNLIPGQEYFLADDITASTDVQPFVDTFIINDSRTNITKELKKLSISTNVIARADRIQLTFKNDPSSDLSSFSVTKSFELDAHLGEQRIPQVINWELTEEEYFSIPSLLSSVGTISTEKLMFDIKLFMKQSAIKESELSIINEFKLNDKDSDLTIPYEYKNDLDEIITVDIDVSLSDIGVSLNNLHKTLISPMKPLMNLLDASNAVTKKAYPDFNLNIGDRFQNSGLEFSTLDTKLELESIKNELGLIIFNSSPLNFGLNEKMGLLSDYLKNLIKEIENLEENLKLQHEQHKIAKIEFQSSATLLQQDISTSRNDYLLQKATYENLLSQKEILEQKRNAVLVYINKLTKERDDLINAQSISNNVTVSIDTQLQTIINELNLLIASLDSLNTTISNKQTQIVTLSLTIKNLLSSELYTQDKNPSRFKTNNYYSLVATNVINDTVSNEMENRQRLWWNLWNIESNQIAANEQLVIVTTSKNAWQNLLEEYSIKVIEGTINTAQQLIYLDQIKVAKAKYDLEQALYDSYIKKLNELKEIRNKLKIVVSSSHNKIIGELFTQIANPSLDPTHIWPETSLITYIAKINRPSTSDIHFTFRFREDTGETGVITIPAGQTTAQLSVYQNHVPDTRIDNGISQWVAKIGSVIEIENNVGVNDLFNLNKFNETLRNDNLYLGYENETSYGEFTNIYSLDPNQYKLNPFYNKYKGILTNVSVLQTYTQKTIETINNMELREELQVDISSHNLTKESIQNNIDYKTNQKEALEERKNIGEDSSIIYQVEINLLNQQIDYYTTTDEEINILGSNLGLNKIDTLLINIVPVISDAIIARDLALEKLNTALKNLEIETEKALGIYITAIGILNAIIKEKTDFSNRVKVMFTLYEEKVSIAINIYNNLVSILSSGLFSETEMELYKTLRLYIINRLQYQEALVNIFTETFDFIINLGNIDNVRIPDILTFTCGINGLVYPQDMKPWIFSKGSGKITTKEYPGAVSIGTALTQNILILNIHRTKTGDISEFLNVYGNANDFLDQLTSISKTNTSTNDKTKMINIISKIEKSQELLSLSLQKVENTFVRKINDININVKTTLSLDEMNALDSLVQDTQRRELVYRLIYMKFFGSKTKYNPMEYLLQNFKKGSQVTWSESSYYSTGNTFLNNNPDILNEAVTSDTFKQATQKLINLSDNISETVLKNLFSNKISLFKDRDIILYLTYVLKEPLINYVNIELELEQYYTSMIQYRLDIERLNLSDNPITVDPFENPALSLEEATNQQTQLKNSGYYNNLINQATSQLNTKNQEIANKELSHTTTTQEIVRYKRYMKYYKTLLTYIDDVITYTQNLSNSNISIKNSFIRSIELLDSDFLSYYKKTNKLPNVMWDIFRITNGQRTKWNYTYLALRIMGMQKELINVLVNNNIQYSPINSELNELKIKKNASLANDNEAEAYSYQVLIDSLEAKKTQFTNTLENYINEFNIIQRSFNKPVITSNIILVESNLVQELYIQNPNEYNLSYSFEPYPSYKNI